MKTKRMDFLTFNEAKSALTNYCLSFNTILDYRHSYKDVDKRLPANPDKTYSEWIKSFEG